MVQTKIQELPKWFNGELYDEGGVVSNPFTGEKFYLTNVELSMYDFIKGAEIMMGNNIFDPSTSKLQRDMIKGLDWFRRNNAKAYMVLLD